jgi:hypothetical protein
MPRAVKRSGVPSRRDDLYFDRLLDLLVPVEQPHFDRPKEDEHGKDEKRGEYCRNIEAETDGHSDRRHHPYRCSGGEAVNLVALAKDGTGAEKADACHHLSCDSRRVSSGVKDLEAQRRKQTRPDSDKAQGFDAGGMAAPLTLQADRYREDRGDQKPKREIGVAQEWQLLSLYPAGRRVGLCLGARRTLEDLAGRGC